MGSVSFRQLLFCGGIGGMTLFGAIWMALAPESVRNSAIDSAMLMLAGNTYYGEVQCGARSKDTASLIEGLVGRHGGERVSVRAWSYREASRQLQDDYPGCHTNVLERKKRNDFGIKIAL